MTADQRRFLQILRVLRHLLARAQPHIRLLPIRTVAGKLSPPPFFSWIHRRAHGKYLYLENRLHRLLDFRLRRLGRNLELSARNIKGLELIAGNEVHPYHLLRYDRVIFSHPAIEKLQLTLKNSVSKRQHKAAEEEGEGAKKAAAAPRKRTRHEKAAEVA